MSETAPNLGIPELPAYREAWRPDDPHANFKAEVANYTTANPMPSLNSLSRETGIPAPCLIRYVLVKWVASGSEAQMAIGPIVLQQMRQLVADAEAEGSAEARLEAYQALKAILDWLVAGQQDPPPATDDSGERDQ